MSLKANKAKALGLAALVCHYPDAERRSYNVQVIIFKLLKFHWK